MEKMVDTMMLYDYRAGWHGGGVESEGVWLHHHILRPVLT